MPHSRSAERSARVTPPPFRAAGRGCEAPPRQALRHEPPLVGLPLRVPETAIRDQPEALEASRRLSDPASVVGAREVAALAVLGTRMLAERIEHPRRAIVNTHRQVEWRMATGSSPAPAAGHWTRGSGGVERAGGCWSSSVSARPCRGWCVGVDAQALCDALTRRSEMPGVGFPGEGFGALVLQQPQALQTPKQL